MFKEILAWVAVGVALVALSAGVVILGAVYEARTFTALTGVPVTWQQAVWVEMRVTEPAQAIGVKDE